MPRTRCAVVGVGYLGKFHAQKYSALPNAELVAVVDVVPQRAAAVASDCNCRAVSDYRELIGQIEAVSIAVPTSLHYEVAREFLSNGIHVLLEKPVATTVAEAEELNRIARQNNAILQAGHLERFNAALQELAGRQVAPRFIESHRLASFTPRCTDVNVVLDLMIHDIDIILSMVDSPVKSLAASGARVLSSVIDIANARIEFDNGCVANITSSRVSMKTERKMRIFQKNSYICVDFKNRGLSVMEVADQELFPGAPAISCEEKLFEESDALKLEIAAFLDAIQIGTPVLVTGEDGQRALETAIKITELMQSQQLLGREPAHAAVGSLYGRAL